MRKKIKVLLLAFTIFCFSNISAQHSDEVVPNYIPPSPATASLGSFGNIPVGLDTGKPNINLEIFNLKEGSISIPISINYSSSGVAVDATSSQLGIDWGLIASGVVSRQVNGMDDFIYDFYSPNTNTTEYCLPNSILAIGTGTSNTEKDIFNYSAFGISGKFIFDGANIIQISPNKNKIELLNQAFSDGSVHRMFKITDTSGTEFYFGDNDTSIEFSNNRNLCSSPVQIPSQTGWYLTKIKKPDGTVAVFKYSIKSFNFTQAYSQFARTTGAILINDAGVGEPCVSSIVTHSIPYLTEIDLNDKKIIFDYQKLDSYTEDSNQLTKITVYRNAADVLKSFDFSYYLIQRNTSSDVLNQYTTSLGLNTKLIFLKDVKEYTADRSNYISKFAFDYYSPEQLPPRFSFSKDIFGYYNAAPNTNFVYNNLTPDDGDFYKAFLVANANRKPNPLTAYFGMLKNITYPTKGKTEIVYGSNSVYGDEKIYPPSTIADIGYQASGGLFENVVISDPIPITFNQTAVLRGFSEVYPVEGQACTYALSHGAACKVELINAATNEVVKSVTAQPTISVNVDLVGGITYKIRVTTVGSCINTNGSLTYYKDPVYTVKINKPLGGVRVSKTLDYDNNGNIVTKKYYYGTLDCLDCSTGSYATASPSFGANYDIKPLANQSGNQYTMYSSTRSPLSSFNGSVLTYGSVIESYGENFENGGVLHVFDNNMDEFPSTTCGDYIRGGSYSNGFYMGEVSNLTFRKQSNTIVPVSSEEFIYGHNTALDVAFTNFFGGLSYTLNNLAGSTDYFYNFNIYKVRSEWHYLSQKKSTTYDLNGLNPVTTTTNYNYNNSNHLQLTSQSTTSSKGELIETKYFYPQDAEMAAKPFAADLIAKNIVTPLDTQSLKAGNKLSEKLTVYENSASTSNLLLPKYIYANKGSLNIDNTVNTDKKITFDQYDDRGNVIQYTQEKGIPVSIIWGYNKTQPIAKIDNLAYSSIPAATITNLQTLSNTDTDNCLTGTCTEQLLRNALNALRSSFPDVFISTYTYNPLVGVTSMTDPKGVSTYYEYDSFGRLKFVKDKDLNVVQKYCYNYKGQQIDCGDNSSTTVIVYKSTARSGSFTKNNCASGGTASSLTYSQAEGVLTSTLSQADADASGLTKFNTDGQAYANTNGTCTFSSIARSGSFIKNNCASGGTGSSVSYSQGAGASTSTVSQADADSKGLTLFNTNGQANANANGTCTFSSIARSGSFTKSNCASGGAGSSVTYSQAAGVSISTVSQADADSLGLTKFNTDGQAYANTNGTCTFSSIARSGSFTKNNCASGGAGSNVSYSQAVGASISTVSQADADALGLTKFNTDGQAYANANGTCTFYSTARSGSFTKNNCASGGTGSSVSYSQAAGASTSTVSQADADSSGLTKFNTDGQANANTNGTCTFSSIARSGSFAKNNCASGGTGSSVSYNQAAGASISTVSQTDADALGLTKFNTDGQAYANTNGTCTFYSIARSGSFTRNNCAAGSVASSVTYSQAAGASVSTVSQADADALGLTKFNTDGQAYANTNGTCTQTPVYSYYYTAPESNSMTIYVSCSIASHPAVTFNFTVNYTNKGNKAATLKQSIVLPANQLSGSLTFAIVSLAGSEVAVSLDSPVQ